MVSGKFYLFNSSESLTILFHIFHVGVHTLCLCQYFMSMSIFCFQEIGDVDNWARSIETDMRTISSALEYTYKRSNNNVCAYLMCNSCLQCT